MPHDQEHALDSLDHTGTISDTQHGTRGGGTLHPAVTGAVNGFMSAADKTKLDAVSVFGTNRAYNSADSETTYSGSTSWQQKVRLAASIADSGTYRIEWYMEMRNQSSISSDILARAQVDDATTLFETNIECKDNTNYIPISGFIEIALVAGTRNIDLDYSLEVSSDIIAVRRARLSVFRVA